MGQKEQGREMGSTSIEPFGTNMHACHSRHHTPWFSVAVKLGKQNAASQPGSEPPTEAVSAAFSDVLTTI